MYTRGQFAIVGKVGRKALRLWDEEGLLTPSFVNEENGYNYYDESQLITLEKIKRLRKIGLSIYEIKQIFAGKSSEKELIDSKIREMDYRLQEVRDLVNHDEEEMKHRMSALLKDAGAFMLMRMWTLKTSVFRLENFMRKRHKRE